MYHSIAADSFVLCVFLVFDIYICLRYANKIAMQYAGIEYAILKVGVITFVTLS